MIVCPSADLNTSIVCDVSHCQILMCHDIVVEDAFRFPPIAEWEIFHKLSYVVLK